MRIYAEGKLEDRVAERAGGRARASASISSFPFVGRLLVQGEVPKVSFDLEEVAHQRLTFASVEVSLRGVRFDRGALWSGKVRLTGLDSGTVTVAIDAGVLGRIVGRAIDLGAATVEPSPPGQLVLRTPAGRVTVPVPTTDVIACRPGNARVVDGQVRLSCTLSDVPPGLRR